MIKRIFFLAAVLLALTASHAIADSDSDSDSGSDSDGGSSASSSSGSGSSGSSGGGSGNPYANEVDFLRLFHPVHLEPKLAIKPTFRSSIAPDREAVLLRNGWDGAPLLAGKVSPTSASNLAQLPVMNTEQRFGIGAADLGEDLLTLQYRRLYRDTADDIAVVIGNQQYLGTDIPNNLPANRDANAFVAFVKGALGVAPANIIRVDNATQANMLRLFGSSSVPEGQLHDWVKPQKSRVYVYYAGHGAPSGPTDSFLVPVDADGSRLALNGFALSTLYDNLGRLPAKQVWLVMESCFSGVSQNGAIVANASPIFARSTNLPPPTNLSVFSAARVDQIASWELDKSHGLFTKYFLLGMSGKADDEPTGNQDGTVTNNELNVYLRDNLSYWARRYYGRDQVAQIQNWSQP